VSGGIAGEYVLGHTGIRAKEAARGRVSADDGQSV